MVQKSTVIVREELLFDKLFREPIFAR